MTPEQIDPHTKAADAVHENRPVDARYVRSARPGKRILWILLISLGAVAVLLLGMWFLSNGGFQNTNSNAGQQAVDAQAFNAETSSPSSTTASPAPQPEPAQ